ncbi:acyl-CoA dehydrogenase [Actinomadura sp. LD22]|uniref:Acyl-CoA dehydrogenase n=1 Tax=Actinomadura physcomitrii TaxID=2650748 RepID=A0A6I4M7I0_9ACTN|nr:acyl-CoA dehydrogenase family protein [Actinomadura physcomitrii]MWA01582.1 acyl-CoA dehydrogenase [Actinomadura physcomitrii]
MKLSDSPEEAEFRAKARDFLEGAKKQLPADEPELLVDKVPYWKQWQRILHEAGYAGLWWPAEYGGGGVGPRLRAVFMEELDRVGAPDRLNTIGEDFIGPTIIDFGTEAQKRGLLPRILRGEDIWCQLFSEPGSGSDLASLRTRATRVEGGWRVDGQKVWTSRAQIAQRGFLLARTTPGRHDGLTCFVVGMDSPGITVRPLAHMLGEAEFNEVFFDGLFIPDDQVVGEVDKGWRVAVAALAHERVGIATGRVNTQRAVGQLVEAVRERRDADGRPLGERPEIRQRLADLASRALVHYIIGQRAVALETGEELPGPFASIGKLYFTPLVQEIADLRLSLDGLAGQLAPQDNPASSWLRLAYQSRGTAIAGGTSNIQRNVLAERMLGMPRAPRPVDAPDRSRTSPTVQEAR